MSKSKKILNYTETPIFRGAVGLQTHLAEIPTEKDTNHKKIYEVPFQDAQFLLTRSTES